MERNEAYSNAAWLHTANCSIEESINHKNSTIFYKNQGKKGAVFCVLFLPYLY